MSEETCQRCKRPEPDLRTLWMACFYAMEELKLPFENIVLAGKPFYTLRVCKDCRANWLKAIKHWFDNPVQEESPGSGIYVRELGTNREITMEEWNRRQQEKS